MEIDWIEGRANVGIEMICPGVHITQSQWNEPFRPSRYDYISDYECPFPSPIPQDFQQQEKRWGVLQKAKATGTNVPIVRLVHVTDEASADRIVERNGFTGRLKIINENVKRRFSWWSGKFDEDDVESVRRHLADHVIDPFIGKNDQRQVLRDQFATSDAFTIQGRYGGVYFTYTIVELCGFYATMMGIDVGKLRFKVLGTYSYKKEIMHAVCVCGDEDAKRKFNTYPDVPTPEDGDAHVHAVVRRNADGKWEWKPQATATEICRFDRYWQNYPMYCRWEHVAFAFYLPSEDHLLAVDDIKDHVYPPDVLTREATPEDAHVHVDDDDDGDDDDDYD